MTDARPSKKQRELLQFIDGFIKGNGYGPSYREIMRALGYKSVSTVAVHVDGLIARGFIRKKDHSARSIEVITTQNAPEKEVNLHEKWLAKQIKAKVKEGCTPEEQKILQDAAKILGVVLES
jgi:repressor LexA